MEPNRIKAFTRAGMGSFQGRQCNYTVAHMLAEVAGKVVPDIALSPLKPLTLRELTTLNTKENDPLKVLK